MAAMPVSESKAAALFADVVIDRPLDQVYTYSVPEEWRNCIGIGKRVEVPFGRGDRATVGFCVHVHHVPPSHAAKSIQRVLDDSPLISDSLMRLTRWMADYYLCGWGQVLTAVVPAGVRGQAGLRDEVLIEAVQDDADGRPKLTAKQQMVWQHLLSAGEALEAKELMRRLRCGPVVLQGLIEKGYARQTRRKVEKTTAPPKKEILAPAPSLMMNGAQGQAWQAIESAINRGGFQAFLLYGVTGSGKTEIYLKAIETVVARGKEAIVLVPEISLTPQTSERFQGRCGEVAVLHSHLSDAERGTYWRRVAAGQIQVVVGARSAVFAPARNLGLIVVDEEHESSFKQEQTPRYHGRDVAVMRARLENVPIIMGSATPSLESWHNAQRGQYQLLRLPNRVLDLTLPNVELVDLRHDGPLDRRHALSPKLEYAMRTALKQGGQVMLLLNRRGYSTHVHCPSCGYVATCQHCDLALTFHRQRQALVCHYCAYEQAPLERCPSCKQVAIRYQGFGTEKLQSEIEAKFSGSVVQRMDSDTMQRPGSHQRVLDAFREGRIHILLGTQMIAKGLDFPNVTLVGVVNADVGLNIPDFRAAERTFQLLAQVAGRTGRGAQGGRVLVQTYNPDHPAIELAAAHDYEAFAAKEMEFRRLHKYPPFQRMARIIVRSEKQDAAGRFAEELAVAFAHALRKRPATDKSPGLRLLGPAETPVFRLNNYFRFHFQLHSASAAVLHEVMREVLSTIRPPHGVDLQVDVDPYNMM